MPSFRKTAFGDDLADGNEVKYIVADGQSFIGAARGKASGAGHTSSAAVPVLEKGAKVFLAGRGPETAPRRAEEVYDRLLVV